MTTTTTDATTTTTPTDAPPTTDALEQARADHDQARADHDQARARLEELEQAGARGLEDLKDAQRKRSAAVDSAADFRKATEAVGKAELEAERLRMRAESARADVERVEGVQETARKQVEREERVLGTAQALAAARRLGEQHAAYQAEAARVEKIPGIHGSEELRAAFLGGLAAKASEQSRRIKSWTHSWQSLRELGGEAGERAAWQRNRAERDGR